VPQKRTGNNGEIDTRPALRSVGYEDWMADELYGERGFDKCYVDARVEVDNSCNALWVNGVRVR
jgi:hypothetical protein